MKKVLLTLIIFCAMIFPPNVYAGMVSISDVGAEKFVAQIQNEISAKGSPIRITEVWRNSEMDIAKDRLYGWRCKFGMKNSAKPDGDIIFWANEQGYVQGLKINYDNPNPNKNSSFTIIQEIIFHVMTDDDISKVKFYRKQDGHIEGFYVNPKNNKHYCVFILPRIRTDGSNIVDWATIFVANSNIDDPLEISGEMLLNEMSNNGSWSQDPSEKKMVGEVINK